jgi:ferredoxin
MPSIHFAGASVPCLEGANLRSVLLRARLPLYNGVARALHCRGMGTCGTCAVRIEGPVSEPTPMEKVRLRVPPHDREAGLRLACQVNVLGDLRVTKYDGLFGQGGEPVAEPEESGTERK